MIADIASLSGTLRVDASPWCRDVMTDDERAELHRYRGRNRAATMTMRARHPGGPYTVSVEFRDGRPTVAAAGPDLRECVRQVVARVVR